jgi:hypothetical protein
MIYNDKKYFIDDRIFKVKFSCDIEKCKGECCTMKGAIGAPVLGTEIQIINDLLEIILKYIPEKNKEIIANEGFYKVIDEKLSLNNVGERECVFSYFESGKARCAFQQAFYRNEIEFKKPISCELFPIRISGEYEDTLRYEKFYECEEALIKGKYEDISIFEFVKDAIIRKFGNGFYDNLVNKIVNEV